MFSAIDKEKIKRLLVKDYFNTARGEKKLLQLLAHPEEHLSQEDEKQHSGIHGIQLLLQGQATKDQTQDLIFRRLLETRLDKMDRSYPWARYPIKIIKSLLESIFHQNKVYFNYVLDSGHVEKVIEILTKMNFAEILLLYFSKNPQPLVIDLSRSSYKLGYSLAILRWMAEKFSQDTVATLNLRMCAIYAADINSIYSLGQFIEQCPQLSTLNLGGNLLSKTSAGILRLLCRALANLSQLTTLNLKKNNLGMMHEDCLWVLCNVLVKLPRLTELDISFNNLNFLTDDGLQLLCQTIEKCSQLATLKLNDGQWSSMLLKHLQLLGQAIAKCPRLVTLETNLPELSRIVKHNRCVQSALRILDKKIHITNDELMQAMDQLQNAIKAQKQHTESNINFALCALVVVFDGENAGLSAKKEDDELRNISATHNEAPILIKQGNQWSIYDSLTGKKTEVNNEDPIFKNIIDEYGKRLANLPIKNFEKIKIFPLSYTNSLVTPLVLNALNHKKGAEREELEHYYNRLLEISFDAFEQQYMMQLKNAEVADAKSETAALPPYRDAFLSAALSWCLDTNNHLLHFSDDMQKLFDVFLCLAAGIPRSLQEVARQGVLSDSVRVSLLQYLALLELQALHSQKTPSNHPLTFFAKASGQISRPSYWTTIHEINIASEQTSVNQSWQDAFSKNPDSGNPVLNKLNTVIENLKKTVLDTPVAEEKMTVHRKN